MNKNELLCVQQYEYDKVNEFGREFNLKQRAKAIMNSYVDKRMNLSAVEIVGDL